MTSFPTLNTHKSSAFEVRDQLADFARHINENTERSIIYQKFCCHTPDKIRAQQRFTWLELDKNALSGQQIVGETHLL